MKPLRDFLRRHSVIGLDPSIFIYHLEDHPRYGPVTADLLTALEKKVFRGVTSYLTLMEILVKPKTEISAAWYSLFLDGFLTSPAGGMGAAAA